MTLPPFLANLWVVKIFGASFGSSDVQSNYTRVYVWMANQLGHVTLGLSAALLFYWVADAMTVMLGPHWLSGDDPDANALVWLLALLLRAAAFVAVVGPTALLLALTLGELIGAGTGAGRRVAAMAIAVAAAAIAVSVALPSGAAAAEVAGVDLGGCLWGVLALMAITLRLAGTRRAKALAALLFLAVFGLCAGVLATGWLGGGADWGVAAAAGLASAILWGVKEFSNDQRGIADEIGRAKKAREDAGGPFDAAPLATEAYRCDGREDSYADLGFCAIGAVLGVCVLADSALIQPAGWTTGAELIALLAIAVYFLLRGEVWASRAQALDRCGAPFASRLAVYAGRPAMRLSWPGGGEAVAGSALDAALAFADGALADSNDRPVRHMLICGAPGAGKTPFGCALVSEAALADISLRTPVRREPRRCARYLTVSQLRRAPTRPTKNERGYVAAKDANFVLLDDAGETEADFRRSMAAAFAADGGEHLGDMTEDGRRTAWVLDVPDDAPDPDAARADLIAACEAALRTELAGLGADGDGPVALVELAPAPPPAPPPAP